MASQRIAKAGDPKAEFDIANKWCYNGPVLDYQSISDCNRTFIPNTVITFPTKNILQGNNYSIIELTSLGNELTSLGNLAKEPKHIRDT